MEYDKSYGKRTWVFKVVNRQQGGFLGGGYTTLTEKGAKLLKRYECLEKEISEFANEKFREYFLKTL